MIIEVDKTKPRFIIIEGDDVTMHDSCLIERKYGLRSVSHLFFPKFHNYFAAWLDWKTMEDVKNIFTPLFPDAKYKFINF